MPKTILITGATRGLGLAFAQALAQETDVNLVLGVRDMAAGQKNAVELGADVVHLDLASRASIDSFVAGWDAPLYAIVNNAGMQNVGPVQFSPDGVEATLAVNHLGPLALTTGLLPYLSGGTVLGIGSGTHNPEDKGATRFGFRGGRFTSILKLARGEVDADSDQQAGFDRYATSKLLSMAIGVELSRRHDKTRFLCLDPGLMPGTGLARTAPPMVRALWNTVLPLAVPLISGASTPTRSAAAGFKLLMGHVPSTTGGIYNHHAAESDLVWHKVRDPEFGSQALDQSLAFLKLNLDAAA